MARKLLMGIDGGTRSIRVGFFDFDGREISFAATEYEVLHRRPGWAEQRPDDWWRAFKRSLEKAMEKGNVTPDEIGAMCFDATCCTVVMCKEDGTPVRDAIMWMDVRASREADDITATQSPDLGAAMKAPVENMPCKLLWVKRNEREIYDSAQVLCEYQEWMMYKLTGVWSLSLSTASWRWYYLLEQGRWSEIYDLAGLGDAPGRFPKNPTWPGDVIGRLAPEAAEELGLSPETLVVQGPIDSAAGVVGMGVTRPGEVTLVTGSSHLAKIFYDTSADESRAVSRRSSGIIRGLATGGGGQTSSGSIINWFKENYCHDVKKRGRTAGCERLQAPRRTCARDSAGQ